MKSTKCKKRSRFFLTVCCAVTILALFAVFTPSVSAKAEAENGWSVVKQDGYPVCNIKQHG